MSKYRYPTYSRLTTTADDQSYWKVLMEYWGKDDLIHFQQDIVPTMGMIESLAACLSPVCTYPHKLRSGYGLYEPKYGPTWEYLPERMELVDPDPYNPYVGGSGMALVKISREVQQRIPLGNYDVNNQHWSLIDSWISGYMYRRLNLPWHVHLPEVRHNHF